MTDVAPEVPSPNVADGYVSKETYEALKRELELKTQSEASANARTEMYEAKERARMAGWQTDVKDFFNTCIEEHGTEAMQDISPLKDWSDDYVKSKDIHANLPIARAISCASKTIKRLRDDASVTAKQSEVLSSTMKENEELKEKLRNVEQRLSESNDLLAERQASLSEIEKKVAHAEMAVSKTDFSKLASREKNAENEAEVPTGVHQVVSNASKGKAPFQSPLEDPLMSFVNGRGGGGLRMRSSSTSHSLLGSAGEPSDLAALIRSA